LFVETKAFPQKDKSGNVVSVIETTRNITERHLLEAEQLKTQKLEAIGTLAGGIAHDFNNLLQGIFGYVSMAKITSNHPEKVLENLDQAEKALSLSVNLTTQLLTFAKGGNPVKKKVDLSPVIENAAKFALSGSRCECRLHLSPNLWPMEVDAGQISQVVQNIVLNASEAMPEGGIVHLTSKNIPLSREGRQIRISIKDTGMGIPESYRTKIFDPYFTTKQKGSGLGLATSYSIVKNHGGSIDVESKQNKGTTFTITLPACEPAALEKKAVQPEFDVRKQNGRIILMDDDAMIRDLARIMVETLGHEIELACHGEEAIEKYRGALMSENPFDLVILDLTIKGGMGGQETIRQLQEIDPNVKAVVSSGYSDDPVVSEYHNYGFQGMLNKPYTIQELEKCLNKMFR
jgi:nitrogen-specific signal transduction histidine kinase/ActR/RegA family two-component response regulator